MLKCGICGFSITASQKIKYYKRTNNKATYTYYRCTRKNKAVDCHEMPIRESDLQTQFINILKTVDIEDDFKEWAERYYQELSEHESKNVTDINANIQKQIVDIDKKIGSLLDMTLSQSISKEEHDKKRHDLLVEKSTLQEKLNESPDWLSKVNKALDTANNIESKFKSELKDEKRRLLRDIGSDLFLEGGIVRPVIEKPFFVFADAKNHPEKYFKRIEPVDYPFLSPQTITLAKLNPTWLPREDSNL